MNNKNIADLFSAEEVSNMLINFNRMFLNREPHIKKYDKLRKLHTELTDSMDNFIVNGKYKLESKNFDGSKVKELKYLDFNLEDPIDLAVVEEMFFYKHLDSLKCVCEVYLEKNKIRNELKKKLLKAMLESHASLFKVIGAEPDEGYVTYEDVVTHEKLKIIDIRLSSTLIAAECDLYIYNRIVKFEDIVFGTGIFPPFKASDKEFSDYLKSCKFKERNEFQRCIDLYEICKKSDVD